MQYNGFNFHNESRKEVLDQFGNLALVWVKRSIDNKNCDFSKHEDWNILGICYELQKISNLYNLDINRLNLISNYLLTDDFWGKQSFTVFSLLKKSDNFTKVDRAITTLKHRGQWYLH